MTTITEDARVITINNTGIAGMPKYTYAVVTPTVQVEFLSLEDAHLWMPAIAVRHVTKEVAQTHYTNKINNLKLTNPEFFKH
jgi:hypothetical protein